MRNFTYVVICCIIKKNNYQFFAECRYEKFYSGSRINHDLHPLKRIYENKQYSEVAISTDVSITLCNMTDILHKAKQKKLN